MIIVVVIVIVILLCVITIARILYAKSDDEKEYIQIEYRAQRILIYEAIKMMEKIRGEVEKINQTIVKERDMKKYAQNFTNKQVQAGDFDQAMVGSQHVSDLVERIRKKEEMIDFFQKKLHELDGVYEIMDDRRVISQEDFEMIYKVLNLSERHEAEVKNLLELIENYSSYVKAPEKEQTRYRQKKGYLNNLEMYKAKQFRLQVEADRLRKAGKTPEELEPIVKLLSEIEYRVDKIAKNK